MNRVVNHQWKSCNRIIIIIIIIIITIIIIIIIIIIIFIIIIIAFKYIMIFFFYICIFVCLFVFFSATGIIQPGKISISRNLSLLCKFDELNDSYNQFVYSSNICHAFSNSRIDSCSRTENLYHKKQSTSDRCLSCQGLMPGGATYIPLHVVITDQTLSFFTQNTDMPKD